MKEYIEKEKALEIIKRTQVDYAEAFIEVFLLPAADVVPVRHGRWSHLGGDEWCCTNCGNVINTEGSWEQPYQKYCDECGAKMDKED